MGLRLMSDQAAHLAKQGSTIPHLYPEHQPSVLYVIPKPIGKAKFGVVTPIQQSSGRTACGCCWHAKRNR